MEFRLLGPVQLWSAGKQVELKRRQERLLLAVLLLEPGKAVPADRLIELLWPEELPGNPKRTLQVYVSRLRTALADESQPDESQLVSGSNGYAIKGPPGRTDVELFTSLVDQAKPLEDLEQRRKLLVEALALWRGPALADVASEDVRRRLCRGLEESRWAALELRLTTELALGRHNELLPELAELTADQPTRENLAGIRMRALYRSGRQADALAAYTELVRHLDEDLGVEPGPEIRDLQVAILRQDESLDVTEVVSGPRELPADVRLLAGRDAVLEELSDELTRGRPNGVPAVVCLYGAAGTGKSAAAVRLGHQLAVEYRDGQLFARLQDVHGEAVPPLVVLGRLLRSLGVDGGSMPESLEERASLLRSRLAGKSVLLVFDDAVDAGQLRPLLPADGRCAVIITSRKPLLGLEDATHREILPLDDQTSARLLADLSGLQAADLTEVVGHCVGLPLALRIVGARLSLTRESLVDVGAALASDAERLDYLVAGDRAVRTSLDLTLRAATRDARRLFAYLALVGADEFSSWVSAPLLDYSETAARTFFDELVALGLLQQRRLTPPTYGFHSLVRSYAAELLAETQADERVAVEQRYLKAALRLLTIADEAIDNAVARHIPFDRGEGRELPEADATAATGLAWLDLEEAVIHAAVRLATQAEPRLAGMLALRFHDYLAVRDRRDTREAVFELAVAAVATTAHAGLEAELRRGIFSAKAQRSAPTEELERVAAQGLAAADRAGSPAQRIAAMGQLSWAATAANDIERTIATARSMLELVDANPELESARLIGLDSLATGLMAAGRIEEGIAVHRQIRELSPRGTRLYAIRTVLMAEALLADGRPDDDRLAEASEVLSEAREIVDRIGDELGGAHVGNLEARVRTFQGDLIAAHDLLRRSAGVFARRPDVSGETTHRMVTAWLAVAEGRQAEAAELLRAGIEELSATDHKLELEVLRRELGRLEDHAV